MKKALILLIVLAAAISVGTYAMTQRARPVREVAIGLYCHAGETMTDDLIPVLRHFGYRFRTLDREDLQRLQPGDVDVLLLPGGWYFFKDNPQIADHIRAFVRAGGGFVGICCGEINACQLGLVEADLISMYGVGPGQIEPVDGEHPVLHGVAKKSKKPWRKYDPFTMLRYNGWPMLLKGDAHMIAAYDMDRKVAAIASSEYGKGRVVAFSPHPEGATFAAGAFADRDQSALVFDGLAMGTAQMLDNALLWCAGK